MKNIKRKEEGAFRMTIDEIRKLHYKEEGREEGEMKKAIEMAKEMILDGEGDEKIKRYTKLEEKTIGELRKKLIN
jgi:hypothetical protein